MSFLKLLAPFQQPLNYRDHLTALPWLWGSSCSPMPQQKPGASGPPASQQYENVTFCRELRSPVCCWGRCVANPGLLAPRPFHFLWNSSRIISIGMHASIRAFLEVSLLPLLQGLSPMEKRKMWLGGNSNEFLQIAFV